MKKIVRLTESELSNLIKKILKEESDDMSIDTDFDITIPSLGKGDDTVTTKNCYKEYRNPESKTDPYKYRMGPECIWQTKSVGWDNVSEQTRNVKLIKDWTSLLNNEKANRILNKWYPNAKSDCLNCMKKTPITTDCPKYVDCNGDPHISPCRTKKMQDCIKSGKTHIRTYEGGLEIPSVPGLGDCPKTLNCMPTRNGDMPKLCKNQKALEMCKKQGMKVSY